MVAGSVCRADALHGGHRLTQRGARREVEREGDGGLLAGVVHAQRAHRRRRRRERGERHQRPLGRADVEHVERRQVLLVLRQQLQHHPVLVVRREDRRDLVGAVGVVQRLFDLLHGEAERGHPVAVDVHVDLRVLDLEIARDVAQDRHLAQPRLERRRVVVQRLNVRALQRELVQGLARASADADHRGDLEVGADSRDVRQLRRELARDARRHPAGARRAA